MKLGEYFDKRLAHSSYCAPSLHKAIIIQVEERKHSGEELCNH